MINAMYVLTDEELGWIALVFCSILGDDREHGWYSSGSSSTPEEAIEKLQKEMRAA